MTTTPGPQHLPTEWVPRLASLVAALRADWDEPGVRSVLARVCDRPLGAVAIAAVTAALTRTDQRTPAIIAADGSHWTTPGWAAPKPSGIVTYCDHGEPGTSCTTCHPRTHRGVTRTDEQRQAIRDAISEGRAHLDSHARKPVE